MSSHAGASGVNGSSRVGGRGAEDASEDNSNNETYTPCLKALRPRLRCADPAGEGRSSSVEQLPNIQTRSTPSSRTAAGDLHHHSFSSSREPDPFWVDRRMSKREKNRIKCLRRRQRRRERWRQSQLQESRQVNYTTDSSSEDDEDVSAGDREGYICAVCLDVYFSPYMCHPCNHIFCEPCLRTLAKNSPTNTPCPLCRTIITHVFFQKELNQTARTFFPKEYLSRKQNFQKASCAKWPLPSCRKLFRIFGGFQRQSSPMARRQFPHGGGYRLDAMDFEDDSRGWRFDMDMVIIYIYSVNWVIGFFIFCFLCYLFFPSF
ncbi:E3 ubiquitin-protein ligase RNF180 [Pagrus major]|uniref:E3 ubiquitin-protein ligase RNF180 n=1 Tax=Pagrus major TaxID=143350 RepID=UPI003CC87D74